jgi:hypothetical protein
MIQPAGSWLSSAAFITPERAERTISRHRLDRNNFFGERTLVVVQLKGALMIGRASVAKSAQNEAKPCH